MSVPQPGRLFGEPCDECRKWMAPRWLRFLNDRHMDCLTAKIVRRLGGAK